MMNSFIDTLSIAKESTITIIAVNDIESSTSTESSIAPMNLVNIVSSTVVESDTV